MKSKFGKQRVPREAEPQNRRASYSYQQQRAPPPATSTASDSGGGRGDVRRTFNIHHKRHNHYHPTSSSASSSSTTVPFTPSSPTSLYYFKPADNSPKPTASIEASYRGSEKDNLAVETYLPKYVVYPSSTPSPQKYLKKAKTQTFRPVGSYDAPTTKSIYREETSGLKKVMILFSTWKHGLL